MAKTKSPLLSAEAHGKIARSLIYSKRKTGQLTRAMHYPKKEPSLKQWTQRHIVGLLTAHWQCMTDDEHNDWNSLAGASSLNLPGYQYFLKLAQADLYAHHGLIAYWSLNESSGATLFDSSGNSINGLLFPSYPDNCPTRVKSFRKEYGNALDFSLGNYFIFIAKSPELYFKSLITLECWFKLKDLSDGSSFLFLDWAAPTDDRVLTFFLMNRRPHLDYSWDGINQDWYRWNVYQTIDWTHLVLTLSSDHLLRCYTNGVQLPGTRELASFHDAVNHLYFGGSGGANSFNGFLDEARIYNRALGPAEIKKHYQLLRLDKKRQPLLRL